MKLHIGNLPKNVTDAELTEMIKVIAPPTTVEIVKDFAGISKGFGFADFATDDDARAVISAMDGRDVGGQALKLGQAKPRRTDAPRA
jgi:RNA recognition motif-containing protein